MRHTESLAHIPLFRSLDPAAIRRLDTQCIWRRAKAAEAVVGIEESSTELFFVARGHLRVVIRGPGRRNVVLRDIHDGEYFGELAAIDHQPRSAEIVAISDSIIARMPANVFRAVVHAHPDVCDSLLALLASQIRLLAKRVNEFSTLDVRHRIYAELLRLARPSGPAQAVVSPPPTHADLAARVSTQREAVTRELGRLERSGLIARRRGGLTLLDPARLKALVDDAVRASDTGV